MTTKESSVYIWGKWSSRVPDEVLASSESPSVMSSSIEPTLVPELRNKNVSSLSGGRFFSASLSGLLPLPFSSVISRWTHCCPLETAENGSLWTWGNGESGQLGQGNVLVTFLSRSSFLFGRCADL